MLVYTAIAGEAPPEAFVLEGSEPTAQDLLDCARRARSAMNRAITLLDGSSPDSRLSELGIGEGDLVLLRAHGAAKPETRLEAFASDEVGATQPGTDLPGPSSSRRRKRLTEYEEVTQLLQWSAPYHTDGSVRPLYQVWSEADSALRCSDWDAFRSPDALHYRTYVAMQAEAERAVQAVFDFAAVSEQLESVDLSRVTALRRILPALHYLEWGACINYQHATRFAMSSWIAGVAEFFMFDSFRHAQLYGRLNLAYGERFDGFDNGLDLWMSDLRFQDARRLIEESQCVLDWAHELVVGGLIVEPLLTSVTHAILQDGAIRAGDSLTPFVCQSIASDKRRHQASTVALVELLCTDPAFGDRNRKTLSVWIEEWLPKSMEAASTLAESHSVGVDHLKIAAATLEERVSSLGVHAGSVAHAVREGRPS